MSKKPTQVLWIRTTAFFPPKPLFKFEQDKPLSSFPIPSPQKAWQKKPSASRYLQHHDHCSRHVFLPVGFRGAHLISWGWLNFCWRVRFSSRLWDNMHTSCLQKNWDDAFGECSNHFLEEFTGVFVYFPSLLKDLGWQLRWHDASTLVCITKINKTPFLDLSHPDLTQHHQDWISCFFRWFYCTFLTAMVL